MLPAGESPAGPDVRREAPPIGLLIVDDHLTFGEALAARLSSEADMEVLATVSDGDAARRAVGGRPVHVALVDDDLSGEDGVAVGEDLMHRCAGLQVVVLSGEGQPHRVTEAVRVGVSGWVPKDESLPHLLTVIRGVARDETWIPPRLLTAVLAELTRARAHADENEQVLARLTDREREVLRCMVDGLDRNQIAARLFLSPNTVRTHTQKVLGKLDVHSALAAVALARKLGMVSTDLSSDA